ncbi:MAG: 50S ribosomal protein L13 [Candidatus Woesearchaeota archaeon]
MIIDATNQVLGRLSSIAAKKALLGEEVIIINCENAVITGNRENILNNYKRKRSLGTFKGPFYSRMPDRFVRRTIRGMLPYKQSKGRDAFKRIKTFIGVPDEYKNKINSKEIFKTENADIKKLSSFKFITVNEVCKMLGGKL